MPRTNLRTMWFLSQVSKVQAFFGNILFLDHNLFLSQISLSVNRHLALLLLLLAAEAATARLFRWTAMLSLCLIFRSRSCDFRNSKSHFSRAGTLSSWVCRLSKLVVFFCCLCWLSPTSSGRSSKHTSSGKPEELLLERQRLVLKIVILSRHIICYSLKTDWFLEQRIIVLAADYFRHLIKLDTHFSEHLNSLWSNLGKG